MRPWWILLGGALVAAEPLSAPLTTQPVDADAPFCEATLVLDAERTGRFIFNWADGWLRCQVRDGQVLFDRNGDARLDAADEPAVAMHDEFHLPLPGIAGDYRCSFSTWDERHLRISTTTMAVAETGLGRIALYDRGVRGRFDAPGTAFCLLGAEHPERALLGRALHHPLTPIIASGGVLYQVSVEGMRLRWQPWEGQPASLRVVVEDGANPLRLPHAVGAVLTLRRTDGACMATVVAGRDAVLPPGDYLVEDDYLGLAPPAADQHPYLCREPAWDALTLAAGGNRLVRRLPESLAIHGCCLDPAVLEIAAPGLRCDDGREYIAKLYGISDAFSPIEPLLFRFVDGDRRSAAVSMEYG
jgi:hypothetical protein